MYKKNYKGRCEKKSLSKCDTICRCYSTIQSVYADKLETDPSVQSFQCNAPLEDEDYTTDFLITRQDGTQYVRECVERSHLTRPKPLTIKLLDTSRSYWLAHNVQDWGIVQMQKADIAYINNTFYRILKTSDNQTLVIDCLHPKMPFWTIRTQYTPLPEKQLYDALNITPPDVKDLTSDQMRIAHERYTLIAPILYHLGESTATANIISSISEEHNISKQTIRRYLYQYLIFQIITVLAPKVHTKEKVLTKDEKNMRWALNKFFYTRRQNSLVTAYEMMLKEKYCDSMGQLLSDHPSFYQFRYFYRKTKKLQTYYISRDGLSNYQRNNRPLLGDGIREFATNIGTGMFDSTVCDIYLIDETGTLKGRPILTTCIDAYSSMCYGYVLSWNNDTKSLCHLLQNILTDKTEWCRKFGIPLDKSQWNVQELPGIFVTDMGREYTSESFAQITETGVTMVNLPPYRPELKGAVEKFFDIIQSMYKPLLKGKGVIDPDFQERGARDYRLDACLTMFDFEKIILRCIIYYNSQRLIERFPYTQSMIHDGVKPYAASIWEWGRLQPGANLIPFPHDTAKIILYLLPRTIGTFTRRGLVVNGMRYKRDDCAERFLQGGDVKVAYDPDDVSVIWTVEKGDFMPFVLVESRYKNRKLDEVEQIKEQSKTTLRSEQINARQAKIDLMNEIELIARGGVKR